MSSQADDPAGTLSAHPTPPRPIDGPNQLMMLPGPSCIPRPPLQAVGDASDRNIDD